MTAAIKRAWPKIWPTAVTVTLLACIPFGLFMAWIEDDASWLWFCAPLLLFLS